MEWVLYFSIIDPGGQSILFFSPEYGQIVVKSVALLWEGTRHKSFPFCLCNSHYDLRKEQNKPVSRSRR